MRRTTCLFTSSAALIHLALTGCLVDPADDVSRSGGPGWQNFLTDTYREPWAQGVFIVNGDTPVANEKKLRELYDDLFSDGALIVHRAGGQDAAWPDTYKRSLTYCISDSFGSRKSAVIAAMNAATAGGWEQAADIDFHYVSSQDANCTASNGNVLFDVRPVRNQPYLARAFFPDDGRSARNVLIDASSFSSGLALSGILTHELGHVLGFRHEHTRPQAGRCFEDDNWRALTPYDTDSVMFYPQCGGTGPALTLSARDRAGAASLYGPPGGGDDNGSGSDDDNGSGGGDDNSNDNGSDVLDESNLSGRAGEELRFRLDVPSGATRVSIVMSGGAGDADLYVKKGGQPSTGNYDCRPYLEGNDESCGAEGGGAYYVMVRGYSSFSGVSLRGTYAGDTSAGTVTGLDERQLGGSANQELPFTLEVPPGGTNVVIEMSGGTGDADLYVRQDATVSASEFDCRPYSEGNDETCGGNGTGTYRVMVRGYTSFAGVRLRGTYTAR